MVLLPYEPVTSEPCERSEPVYSEPFERSEPVYSEPFERSDAIEVQIEKDTFRTPPESHRNSMLGSLEQTTEL